MRILAVDTTSSEGSLAVLEGELVRGRATFGAPSGHAQQLLPELDRLLVSLGLSLANVDAFAVAVGPGSFTGLRIGISSVEGLAFATGRPVVGVSTLEATAFRHRAHQGLVAPLLDARRGEVFGALFRAERDDVRPILEPVCARPAVFLAQLPREKILFVGSGLEVCRAQVLESMGDLAVFAEPVSSLAEEVGRIGARRLERGERASLGSLRAQYLRPSDAEKARR